MATKTLYLARHGEASEDESTLTAAGHRQADLLGRRLRDVPLDTLWHGPLPRTAQTAAIIGAHVPAVPVRTSEAAGDFFPHVPTAQELPAPVPEAWRNFLDGVDPAEQERGRALAALALEQFAGAPPGGEDVHELVVTHAFGIGWLVRDALAAPPWRWLGLNFAHTALTVIRYAGDRPPTVLCLNDMAHLPADLRWTGFAPEHRL